MHSSVIVVGAGPSGLSTACALAQIGVDVTVIDPQTQHQLENPEIDGRDIAITHMTKAILSQWGVWQRFDPANVHPIKNAKVSTEGFLPTLQFERHDDSGEPLGFLVANHCIRKALYQQAGTYNNIHFKLGDTVTRADSGSRQAHVMLENGETLSAKLLIAADSRFSVIRRMMGISASMIDYGRVMVVCNMHHTNSHEHTARETFLHGKTCATLPLSDGVSSIVITVPARLSQALTQLSDDEFNHEATKLCGNHLGELTLIGKRYCYPLVGTYSNRFIAERFALVGDAAVGMHPVTAHGYNLAVRSASNLAACVQKAINNSGDTGAASALRKYEMQHQLQAKPIYKGTNAVVGLFTNDHPIAKIARKAALVAGDHLPGFKKAIVYKLTQTRHQLI